MELPFSKQIDEIKAELEKRIEIKFLRQGLAWRISRLKDLEPDNAAYAKAQATLGL